MSESTVLESINVNKTFSQGGRSIEVLTDLNLKLKNKERNMNAIRFRSIVGVCIDYSRARQTKTKAKNEQ